METVSVFPLAKPIEALFKEVLALTVSELLPNVKVPVPVAIVFPFKVAAVKVEVFNTLELMVSAVTVPFNPLTRNLAEAVEFPPIANASNESSGDIRLELFWKKLIDPEALDQVGTPPTIVKILPFDPPAD